MATEELDLVRQAVGYVILAANFDDEDVPLELDEASLADLDEAWVPVLAPQEPSFLVWCNSD